MSTIKFSENSKRIVSAAIHERAILRSKDQRLISPTGSNNSWLIDARPIFLDAKLLATITDLFWEEYADRYPFQLGGMETASIPLLSAILMKSVTLGKPINGFIVRKERKTYGTGNLIEGRLTEDPIVIVDDVINSGSSLEKVRVILESMNRKITSIFVLIDYQSQKGVRWRNHNDLSVVSPFTLSDFRLNTRCVQEPNLSPIFEKTWHFSSPDPNFFHRVPKSFPVTDGKRVYFGSDCGVFWCLDAMSGEVAWWFRVRSRGHKNLWSTPALYKDKVYFGSYDGNVYCLDRDSGCEIWRYIGADWVGSSPALAPDLGLLFIGMEFSVEGKKGSVAALSLDSGEKVWEYSTKRYTHASPAYWRERQLVACGSNDDEMLLFDAKSGHLRWRFQTKGDGGNGSIRHAPAFDKKRGHVITGCADGWIYVIDVDTGSEVWSVQTDNTIYTIPLIVDDLAFVGSTDKYLYILDLRKQLIRKRIFCESKIFSPPQLIENKVYFGACNGKLYELDIDALEITGTHQLPDAMTNMVAYSPETKLFYVLTYVNELYALKHL